MTESVKSSAVIRFATLEDRAGILECLSLAFAPYRSRYTADAFSNTVLTPETVHRRMSDMTVFVAESAEGKIIGTIACQLVTGEAGHVRGMGVRPEWQGASIAQQLLDRAEQELRGLGCSTVTLDTTEPLDRAMHFYEKHGFTRTGRVRAFFGMPLIEYRKLL
jgi:N-acetylglutamate synthase-like GNAT family acetyltransferase